jgi:hypothetical protein
MQQRQGSLSDKKVRPQVEIERLVPALGRDLLNRLPHHDARGVDDDIEVSAQAFRGCRR